MEDLLVVHLNQWPEPLGKTMKLVSWPCIEPKFFAGSGRPAMVIIRLVRPKLPQRLYSGVVPSNGDAIARMPGPSGKTFDFPAFGPKL